MPEIMTKLSKILKPVSTFLQEKILRKIWFIAIFIAPLLVLIAYGAASIGVFSNIELKILDNKFNERGPVPDLNKNAEVLLIAIDDQAQNALGQYPWPRDYYARMIRNLMQAGASVVAFDLIFSDDAENPQEDYALRDAIQYYKRVVLAGRTSTSLTDESFLQYTAVDELNLQNIFDGTPGSTTGIVYVRNDADGVYRRYHPYSMEFGKQLLSFAYATLQTHFATNDSVERKSRNLFEFSGQEIPSYDGYSVLLNYYGPSKTFPTISASEILDTRDFMTSDEKILFRETMAETGLDSLSLARDESLRELWAMDIFDDPLSGLRSRVKGKICVIGPMFPESKDLFPIPMYPGDRSDENQMYGVEIHATAMQNYIDKNFITKADPLFQIITLLAISYLIFGGSVELKRFRIKNPRVLFGVSILAAFGVLATVMWIIFFIAGIAQSGPIDFYLIQNLRIQLTLLSVLVLLSVAVAYYFKRAGSSSEFVTEIGAILITAITFLVVYKYTNYIFLHERILVPVMPFGATIILAYGASIFYQYFTESRQKKLIRGFFTVYVNRELVDQLIDNPNQFRLGGEKRELSILFSDVKGFTNISEAMDPADLVILLNEYLGAMTDIVFKYGGTLDKYIGDAVMAFWGAPVPQEDHAKRCCWAALEMQEKLEELREKWKSEGKPELYARIGINTGQVIVGNMGSESRFNYTVMGDSVNLAARLEPANKAFGTSIIVSEFTNEQIYDFCRTRELATITVQGKAKPVKIFELVAKKRAGVFYEPLPPAPTAGKDIMAIKKE
ncbi:adenylate/guanylate cyclase with Chase sensor [Chloroherpeton thalassium ATCC 35110]|uniref:Adenylate/guanylate cyclase with Chase sensor n=1 Tax=Chloroherpeton thalassium (strain ATCC 35110 / GB-78) TaxID=517418 RepID=B3QUR5_CHLT3|nr:adenylate/guanylate cyclase domain-containing protein [Chloroherpeton thalassium]ACF12971.1 adenylate/guanylate cyclase with Chase sensor [Chloroherpeton thalassium ATCC 35110]